jgi:hypothetical protein
MTARTRAARLTAERLEDRTVPSFPGTTGGALPLLPLPPLPPLPPPTIPASVAGLAIGYNSGDDARVRVYQTTTQFHDFKAFDNPAHVQVPVATGDVNGDGTPDVIVTLGPDFSTAGPGGGGDTVAVFDGATLGQPTPRLIAAFAPEGISIDVGFYVAAGDFDHDGKADVVVSYAFGGNGEAPVKVYSGADLLAAARSSPFPPSVQLPLFVSPVASFAGITDPNFHGGVTVAAGDVNGDGTADVVVGAGPNGGPRVAVYDGTTLRRGATPTKLFTDFFGLDPALRVGVNVAVMDVNHDGRGDVLVGKPSGSPEMAAVDGATLLASNGLTVRRLWDGPFGDPASTGGVQMVVKDLDGDGKPDLAVANGDRATVVVYRGAYLHPDGTSSFPAQFFDAPVASGIWLG